MNPINLIKLEREINNKQSLLDSEKGKLESFQKILQEKEEQFDEQSSYLKILEETNVLLNKISRKQRKDACEKMEKLGTFALKYIFGSKYSLKVALDEEKAEVEIYVLKEEDGETLEILPEEDGGGGVVDVVSLVLKISMLQAFEPTVDGPILLDEPGKQVSSEHIASLANFLKEIGKKIDRQIIMVTHNNYFAESSDLKLSVAIDDKGVSHVTSI